MNFVEPIRDLDTLENMCSYLKKTNERNHILFMMGIYTGLRISDILKLRIYDIKDKRQLTLREKKTGKQKFIEINPILKRALKEYVSDKDPDEFLIKSRNNYNRPISRKRAYEILKVPKCFICFIHSILIYSYIVQSYRWTTMIKYLL